MPTEIPVICGVPRDLQRLRALADTFPSMERRLDSIAQNRTTNPGLLSALREIADGHPAAGSGARAAARFLLSVYNPDPATASHEYNPRSAWNAWDNAHRAAWLAWAAAPWWC